MGVEDVARICLAPRGTPHQQRQLAIRRRLLGQVVVDAQGVTALFVHVILGHRTAGVRRDVLQGSWVGGGDGHDDRVVHRPGFTQLLDHLDNGRFFLADRDIDANDIFLALVDDGIDRDHRLAGLAVADDQLALAAADRRHRVDGLDAGLQRLIDRLPPRDAGGLELDRPSLGGGDRPLAVERIAERIDDPADHGVADRHLEQGAQRPHLVAFLDFEVVAQHDDADRVLFEVEGQAAHLGTAELDHLAVHDVRQAVDAGNAVADFQDSADLAGVEAGAEVPDFLSQYGSDLVCFEFHNCFSR